MRKMKDSKIEWVGEIPETWSCVKGKYVFTQRNERGNHIDLQLLSPTQKYGVIPQDMYEELSGMSAVKLNDNTNFAMLKTIHKGDYCISLRSFQGGFEYSEYEGVVSPAYQVFYPIASICSGYYKYLFKEAGFIEVMNSYTISLRDGKNISFDDFGNTYIPFPPIDEQQRIADFLDRECERIDGLKADIEEQIETLEKYKRSVITEAVTHGLNPDAPMKDSGVDYIDKIKYNWKISKIGFVCTKLTRGFLEKDPALICSNNGSVMLRDEQHSFGKMVSEDNAMQGIRAGDIAIHGMDTWHGAIGLSTIRGKITRVVHVCDSTEDKRFIVYYLKSLAYQGVYKLISSGVRGNTSDFRSWDKVKDIFICLPETVDEEREICDYLDKIVSATDELISQKQSQIETLETYKKSLIFEYVTGKKEVCE